MTDMSSRFVTLDGVRVHYLEAGSGPAVLFLHGWPTHAGLWRNILPAVASHRRAIALDLPGFGASDKPLDASYSFPYHDRVLTGFLAALEIDRLGLVVHDLGGPIGLHWAANNSGRITELGILNTVVFPELSWMVLAFVLGARLPGINRVLVSQWGLRAAMRFGVEDVSKIDDEVTELYQAPYRDAAAKSALLKAAYGLHPRGFRTIAAALPNFNVPTRILYGERDRILPDVAVTMARLQRCIPHAQLSSIPNCGHFLQEDRPQEVADSLAGFFARKHSG